MAKLEAIKYSRIFPDMVYLQQYVLKRSLDHLLLCRWNNFRQLVPSVTNNDVSLFMRGKLYRSCVTWQRNLAIKKRVGISEG